jgi:hypothetical protein
VARFIAAERALTILSDPENPLSLAKLCDCHAAMQIDGVLPHQAASSITDDAPTSTVLVAEERLVEMDVKGQVMAQVDVQVEMGEQGAVQVDIERDND